jgi:hypothetical protein
MKGILDYGSQAKRSRWIPKDPHTIYGLIGGITGLIVFLPVLYITLLLWELLFYIPYYGNYQLLKALPVLYLLGIGSAAYLGVSFGEAGNRRFPGIWGYRVGSVVGGMLAASLVASAISALSIIIEILI